MILLKCIVSSASKYYSEQNVLYVHVILFWKSDGILKPNSSRKRDFKKKISFSLKRHGYELNQKTGVILISRLLQTSVHFAIID